MPALYLSPWRGLWAKYIFTNFRKIANFQKIVKSNPIPFLKGQLQGIGVYIAFAGPSLGQVPARAGSSPGCKGVVVTAVSGGYCCRREPLVSSRARGRAIVSMRDRRGQKNCTLRFYMGAFDPLCGWIGRKLVFRPHFRQNMGYE